MKKITAKSQPRRTHSSSKDLIQIILSDHKPLKQLIQVMKSEDATMAKKKKAFEEFAPTLLAHAKPEERTLYVSMKKDHDMSVEGTEGDVEHGLADQLCQELKKTKDHDLFMAKVKVLAEMVEHHIEEEEDKLLPEFRKCSSVEERRTLGEQYLSAQKNFESSEIHRLRLVA